MTDASDLIIPIPKNGLPDLPQLIDDPIYTNFDHTWNPDIQEQVERGEGYAQHAARDFCGYVWKTEEGYAEVVWIYNEPRACYHAPDLADLIKAVNDRWGHK